MVFHVPAVKKARIHSVSLFFWKGREGGGEAAIRSNHQSLIGYKIIFIQSDRVAELTKTREKRRLLTERAEKRKKRKLSL